MTIMYHIAYISKILALKLYDSDISLLVITYYMYTLYFKPKHGKRF